MKAKASLKFLKMNSFLRASRSCTGAHPAARRGDRNASLSSADSFALPRLFALVVAVGGGGVKFVAKERKGERHEIKESFNRSVRVVVSKACRNMTQITENQRKLHPSSENTLKNITTTRFASRIESALV